MKAIMVMFDTLNRRMLPPYGCDWVHAPNFQRLADRAVTFDNCYAGSMPCMPARRELHTGRYNFLHRSWGPLEPFDESLPEILKENGVYTHLASDHQHYWEDGGATYHTRYNSWEFSRGQEGDPWKGHVADPEMPEEFEMQDRGGMWRQDWINREYMKREDDQPQAATLPMACTSSAPTTTRITGSFRSKPLTPTNPSSPSSITRIFIPMTMMAPISIGRTMRL